MIHTRTTYLYGCRCDDCREANREYHADRRRIEAAIEWLRTTFLYRPEPWRARAACRGLDPDMFHPTQNGNALANQAKHVCAGCPVRTDCLADHLHEELGIWGGTTPTERRRMRREVAA